MFVSFKEGIRNFRIWLAGIIAPAETVVCEKIGTGGFRALGGGGSNKR